jgi:hypothetical protein
MKLFKTLFFFFASLSLSAQPIPPANLTGTELRSWLKTNWYDGYHIILGYNAAREQMYGYIDKQADGQIYCVYTGFHQAGSYTTYPNPINCEHTIPQSWFGSNDPMVSDIFHLYPTHQDVNSARSNLPFEEITDSQTDFWYIVNGSNTGLTVLNSIPASNIDDYSELNSSVSFEPREDHSGNLARTAFYFYTMYPTQAGNINNLCDLATLYQWHLQDPVDAIEIQRNNRIKEKQGNSNPYIVYPELACRAWGFDCPVNVEEIEGGLRIFPKLVVDKIYINSNSMIKEANVFDIMGKLVISQTFNNNESLMDLQNLNTGLYIIQISDSENHVLVEKIIKQ